MDDAPAILFVDDEENILNSLRRIFRHEGYSILLASHAEQALQIVNDTPELSLIVSDQRMPGMVGAELLTRVRHISPHTQRILLTGYSDMEMAVRAVNEGGITRYLTKPWDDEMLKSAVSDAIMRYKLEKHNRDLTCDLQQKNQQLTNFNERLEKSVRARTFQLRLKIKELEGRDRIVQHMLTVHSREETLELLLQVTTELIEIDRTIIYLCEKGDIYAAAAIDHSAPEHIIPQNQLVEIKRTPIHARAFERVRSRRTAANFKATPHNSIYPFALVPILRETNLLGYIELGNPYHPKPITNDEIQAVTSLVLLAAMAISDANAHQNYDSWKGELDEVLRDLDK